MDVSTVHCAYENQDFPENEFDEDGVHVGRRPRHLLTGDLISDKPGGFSPMGRPVAPE